MARRQKDLAPQLVSKFFLPLWNNRKQYEDQWVDLRKRYIGYLESVSGEEEEWKAQLPDSLTFPFVQAMTSYMYEAFFGAKPYISVEVYSDHQESQEEEEKRKLIEAVLNKQFDEAQVAGKKGIIFLTNAFLYGTSVVRVFWRKDEKKRYYLANGEKRERRYTVFDGPDIKVINLFDFWIDPFCTIGTAEVIVVREIITYDEFRALQEAGYYDPKVKLFGKRSRQSEEYQESKEQYIRTGEQPVFEADPNLVEILEFWIKGYGDNLGMVYHVANRRVVVRQEENPYWTQEPPFISFTPIPDGDKFYGISPIWVARGSIDEFLAHKRLRLDNIKLSLFPMAKARGNVNPDDLKIRMNGVIWLDSNREDVEWMKVPYVSVGVQEEEQLLRDIMFTTGFNEIMAGSIPKTSIFRTSLGASVFSQLAFGRLGLMKLSLAEDISKLAWKFLELNYQYLSEPLRIDMIIPDEEGIKFIRIQKEVTPEILTSASKLVPIASLDPNRQMRKQQFLNLLQIVSSIPPLAARLNEEAIWKELCYDFQFQNKEILFLKPVQEAMAQAQAFGKPGSTPSQTQPGMPQESAALQEIMRAMSQGGLISE